MKVLQPETAYQWVIRDLGDQDVLLNVFLGTRPLHVSLLDGALGGSQSRIGRYLYATYPLTDQGNARWVTALLPAVAGSLFRACRNDVPGGERKVPTWFYQ